MAVHAESACELLKKMSNPKRLMILCLLVDGERTVSELSEFIGGALSQSALSQHLAALREAELVTTRREAQNIYYRLEGDRVPRVLAALKSIYCPDI